MGNSVGLGKSKPLIFMRLGRKDKQMIMYTRFFIVGYGDNVENTRFLVLGVYPNAFKAMNIINSLYAGNRMDYTNGFNGFLLVRAEITTNKRLKQEYETMRINKESDVLEVDVDGSVLPITLPDDIIKAVQKYCEYEPNGESCVTKSINDGEEMYYDFSDDDE